MPNKRPTDHKTVQALTKYEEAFNTLLASASNNGYDDTDAIIAGLYGGLYFARQIANRAQVRIDERKAAEGDKA